VFCDSKRLDRGWTKSAYQIFFLDLQANRVQVINTSREKPEPTGVEQFFTKLGNDYRDKEDQKQINQILEEYRQNRDDPNAWEDAQLKLMTSTISPSRKLEVQNFLNNLVNHQ